MANQEIDWLSVHQAPWCTPCVWIDSTATFSTLPGFVLIEGNIENIQWKEHLLKMERLALSTDITSFLAAFDAHNIFYSSTACCSLELYLCLLINKSAETNQGLCQGTWEEDKANYKNKSTLFSPDRVFDHTERQPQRITTSTSLLREWWNWIIKKSNLHRHGSSSFTLLPKTRQEPMLLLSPWQHNIKPIQYVLEMPHHLIKQLLWWERSLTSIYENDSVADRLQTKLSSTVVPELSFSNGSSQALSFHRQNTGRPPFLTQTQHNTDPTNGRRN